MAAPDAAYAVCDAQVRREDPDRWLAALFLPEAARRHVHALLAFNLEIARVRDAVSEPMLGEIRYQWWRDMIAGGDAPGHPVAEALIDTVDTCGLDAAPLLDLIEARSFDLYDDPMASTEALDGYARATSATLFQLTVQILAPGFLADAAADAAGKAYAITGLIRGLPWQVMRGQMVIPADVLAKYQLPPEEILAHRMSPALGLVLNDLAARARVQLTAMHAALPDSSAPEACLPAFLCEPYLKRLSSPRFNIFETPIDLPRWRKLWLLWSAARRM